MRFGIASTAVWSTFTTAASNGSVNGFISSLTPLTAAVALFNMMLGEIIFGGVGSGLYGFILFVLLSVFIAGLMVGRTPEYLGKKIETNEMKMVVLALLIPNLCMLIGTAFTLVNSEALKSLSATGTHGFTEVLYAITSGSANNGSAFAGLNANTNFYNIIIGVCMLLGRFGVIIPILLISNSLIKKKAIPVSAGTLPTDTLLFGFLTLGIILVVGGLTFFPALCLGPILEHFLMKGGFLF
jgi:K+-transporting ATPase ATPase A chain